MAERLITKAKKGDIHNRRQVAAVVRDKGVVHHLFTEIAPTFAERPGGCTRITKIGQRKGDAAFMAVIELVTEPLNAVTTTRKAPEPAAAPAPEPKADEVEETKAEAAADEAEVTETEAKKDDEA